MQEPVSNKQHPQRHSSVDKDLHTQGLGDSPWKGKVTPLIHNKRNSERKRLQDCSLMAIKNKYI